MNATERDIYYYLKGRKGEHIPVREISRRIGSKRRWHHSPDWARLMMERMEQRGILEKNGAGDYRLRPIPIKDQNGKRWVSPAMARLLLASGKSFEGMMTSEDEDAYYDRL